MDLIQTLLGTLFLLVIVFLLGILYYLPLVVLLKLFFGKRKNNEKDDA